MTSPARLDRAILRVSGTEARTLLHGLLTQDVETLAGEAPRYAALLSPQGKLIADMLLWPQTDGAVLIEADPARAGALLQRLSLYKLRAEAAIEDASSRLGVLWAEAPFAGAQADPRLSALGFRRIAAKAEADAAPDGGPAYEALRLAEGVPDLARDAAADEVFALEALLEELHGVDFRKGCFVGQENVSRMKRRATTRKKFCPIAFEGEALAPGTALLAGEAEIGTVRSGTAGRAIALVRLDRAQDAPLTAAGRPVRLAPPAWLIMPQGEAD